ncbi:MAG: dioxygenase [Isosphaera sp.]|nr:dioxygenase [Isosphaera sp.]
MPAGEPAPRPHYDRLPTYHPADVDGTAAALDEDGFALIPEVLTLDEVAACRARIDALRPLPWDFTGPTDHYKNVFNRDPFWLPYLDRPGVVDLAEAVLGENCHVIGQTAWRSHPDHRGVGLHLDYLPMTWPEPGVPDGVRVPVFLATAHVYLSPQPAELCPTHVIPGSHRAGRRPARWETHWRGRAPQPVLCGAGDVLFFRSDLWHSGSDNRTDQTRYLLQVHYGRREMAQHFAPFLAWRFDPAVLAACNPRQLRLLGDHPQGAYD